MTITVETSKGVLNAFRDENRAIDAMLASRDLSIASQGMQKLHQLRQLARETCDRWNQNYQRADGLIAHVKDTSTI